ncbi:hypothetical protein Hanom_Chr14g01323891 [Helianthus anomalus]
MCFKRYFYTIFTSSIFGRYALFFRIIFLKRNKKQRVNYKFCPLCIHQTSGAILLPKSLQAVSLTFQNLARFVL